MLFSSAVGSGSVRTEKDIEQLFGEEHSVSYEENEHQQETGREDEPKKKYIASGFVHFSFHILIPAFYNNTTPY